MSLIDEQDLPVESDAMVAPSNTNSEDILDQLPSSSSPSLETSPATSDSPSPPASESLVDDTIPRPHSPGSTSPSNTPSSTEVEKQKTKNDWVVDSIVGQRVEILSRYLPWALAFYRHLKATEAGAWTDELEEGVAVMMDLSEEVAHEMDKLDSEGKHLQKMEDLLDVYESQTKIEHARARTLVRGRAAKVEDLRLASLELDELNKVQNKIVNLRHQVEKSKIKYETEKSHLVHLKGLQRQYGRIFQLCGVEVCRIGEVN